ncbi:MAG TPA: TraB/GumN family protein [Allosphingosinicella sp.]
MADAAPSGHPAMWKLADADTTIYLFGTFHLLPQGRDWRTPAFDRALASSGELVLEIGNLDDQMALAQALMKLGMSPGLPPLAQRVPAKKRGALKAMVAESGIPEALLDRMETWAAGLMLTGVTFKRLGLDPNAGVERVLQGPWKASGRPVEGLETAEEQFGFFDRLSEDAQRKFLEAALESPDAARKQFAEMLRAWSAGDVAGIARTFDDETQMSGELRGVLMAQRNAKWAEWLKARMAKPGTVFVAVGAGHLAGADSVQRMLAARGLKVTRLQ